MPSTLPIVTAAAGGGAIGQTNDGVYNLTAGAAIAAGDLVTMKDTGSVFTTSLANLATENTSLVPVTLGALTTLNTLGQFSGLAPYGVRRLDNGAVVVATGQNAFTVYDSTGTLIAGPVTTPIVGTVQTNSIRLYPVPGGKVLVTWRETISSALTHRAAIYTSAGAVSVAAVSFNGFVSTQAFLLSTWFYQGSATTPYFGVFEFITTPGGATASSGRMQIANASTGVSIGTYNFTPTSQAGAYFFAANFYSLACLAHANGDMSFSWNSVDTNYGYFTSSCARWLNGSSTFTGHVYAINNQSYPPNNGYSNFASQPYMTDAMVEVSGAAAFVGLGTNPASPSNRYAVPFIYLVNVANTALASYVAVPTCSTGSSTQAASTTFLQYNSTISSYIVVFGGDNNSPGYQDCFLAVINTTTGSVTKLTALGTGYGIIQHVSISPYKTGSLLYVHLNIGTANLYILDANYGIASKLGSFSSYNTGVATYSTSYSSATLSLFNFNGSSGNFQTQKYLVQASSILGVAQASVVAGANVPVATVGTYMLTNAAQNFGPIPVGFNQQGAQVLGNRGFGINNTVTLFGLF